MKNFIFDVDGTLVDTFNMYIPALKEVLDRHGIHRKIPELAKYFSYSGDRTLKEVGIAKEKRTQVFDEWAQTAATRLKNVTVFHGVENTLRSIAQKEETSLVVATSRTKSQYLDQFANRFTIHQYFDTYVTADDTQQHKPDPAPIQVSMHRMQAQTNDTIYIGDSLSDLQAAHAAHIKFGSALWGAGDAKILAQADYQFQDPREVLELLPKTD
ncbi:HAD family hydrolase [Pediococcus ethanolidurans]|uniref:HAD family hydrolase n=1 Tax=Pediococcus ethanolidurans TaxID=319653 RepID=A0A0R2JYT6_9LACO|nr:HAD family hydrolase [Pediococcus ethanolidurans]KRN82392.1 HAD family hydrolase [Pediococcus ethanolidurans]GEN94318.1 phosphatase [Pediococcus ethanolidurans]SER57659.1 haloacid dehalogenase superfamily, subfamily IA, variant 1 with third motif having Dx(3-4)D or Dx(3-4)E [Pediococcus ethanolidurans]